MQPMERRHLAGNERAARSNCVPIKGALRRRSDVCRQDAGVPLVKHIFVRLLKNNVEQYQSS